MPAVTLQWIVNPGRVYYDIVASRRLDASREQEQAAKLETLRAAASQFYDLVLAQAKVAVAQQSVGASGRVAALTARRARAGTVLAADESRAAASLAGRRQDLILSLNSFYQASVASPSRCASTPPSPWFRARPRSRRPPSSATTCRSSRPWRRPSATAPTSRPRGPCWRRQRPTRSRDVGASRSPAPGGVHRGGGLRTDVGGQTLGPHGQERASAGAGLRWG